MKVEISKLEWYPVFKIDENENGLVDISEEKIKEINEVFTKFDEIQNFLISLYNR